MEETNLAYKYQNTEWTLSQWNYIVEESARVFSLREVEKEELRNNSTAKIIATIPFIANCEQAERTAIAHIALYLTEKRGFQKYCAHLPSDDLDLFNRLEPISHFKGGDSKIIQHGMNMLALIMLEGYKRSYTTDKQVGIYNPITSGVWNYRNIKNKLLNEISKLKCPLLDDLFFGTVFNIIW